MTLKTISWDTMIDDVPVALVIYFLSMLLMKLCVAIHTCDYTISIQEPNDWIRRSNRRMTFIVFFLLERTTINIMMMQKLSTNISDEAFSNSLM